MRFVFLGYDLMLPIAKRLINDGHELVAIMSFPCDQYFNYNLNAQSLAKKHGADYIESPISSVHINSFYEKEVDLFVSAGYPHKIPFIREERAYSINVHPSFLPEARGMMPIPHIIVEKIKSAAGFTIHKLSEDFDKGDILHQEKILLENDDSVESYSSKIIIHAPAALSNLLGEIKEKWKDTVPQDEDYATYFPPPDDATRTLHWEDNVKDIQRRAAAFGRYGCYGMVGKKRLNIFALDGWEEPHQYKPGACVSIQNNIAIIAARDGFITIKDFSLPEA